VLIEQHKANDVVDALMVCRKVRIELHRALEASGAVSGTPMFDTVNRLLGMVESALVY
jgi:hypothetical protein